MKIIPPVPITDSVLLASGIPEPSTGEIVWAASTAYPLGTQRIRTQTHRIYQALTNIPATATTPPEADAANWLDVGPTNRYAMFDTERNTASSYPAVSPGVTIRLMPGKRISSIAMFGLLADSVQVVVKDGLTGPVVYTKTMNLSTRYTNSWYTYFYGEFTYRESAVFNDLPPISTAVIEVTFVRSSGPFFCETLVIGNAVHVGGSKYGIQSDILDFSRVDRDAFGSATLVRRKNVPTMSIQVMVDKVNIPKIRRLRTDYTATPLVFLGVDESNDDYFDAYALIGIFKRMPIVAELPTMSIVSIEVEGL